MKVPRETLIAIAKAVEAAGGDLDDVKDLVDVWERVNADSRRRADRMRYEARTARCSCLDGGRPGVDGRCGRCYGAVEARR